MARTLWGLVFKVCGLAPSSPLRLRKSADCLPPQFSASGAAACGDSFFSPRSLLTCNKQLTTDNSSRAGRSPMQSNLSCCAKIEGLQKALRYNPSTVFFPESGRWRRTSATTVSCFSACPKNVASNEGEQWGRLLCARAWPSCVVSSTRAQGRAPAASSLSSFPVLSESLDTRRRRRLLRFC